MLVYLPSLMCRSWSIGAGASWVSACSTVINLPARAHLWVEFNGHASVSSGWCYGSPYINSLDPGHIAFDSGLSILFHHQSNCFRSGSHLPPVYLGELWVHAHIHRERRGHHRSCNALCQCLTAVVGFALRCSNTGWVNGAAMQGFFVLAST